MTDALPQLEGTTLTFIDDLPAQARTKNGMRKVLWELTKGKSVADACETANVAIGTHGDWRSRYEQYDGVCKTLVAANEAGRRAADAARRQARLADADLVVDNNVNRPYIEPPGLEQFRLEYLGRPTPAHQKPMVQALEDMTNKRILFLGPPESGKDTFAQDYGLWRMAPDRKGMRLAFFMESLDFAKRRIKRIGSYLTDPKVYDFAPQNGVKPVRSCIEDWGPFRWERGMVTPDGDPVERQPWTQTTAYFVQTIAPENDPNLWATGIEGATYGSRIDECIMSDAFTLENQSTTQNVRDGQMAWVDGTLDTRLGTFGRLIVLGTMLPVENNYEVLLEQWTEGARIVYQDGYYTKYSNGVATVIYPAMVHDHEGNERSYWEERFPTYGRIHLPDGRVESVEYLTDAEEDALRMTQGANYEMGMVERRARMPSRMWDALYMGIRDPDDALGDFTDSVLDAADDPDRTLGVVYPHEVCVVGADPARTAGAGYVAWAVDIAAQTATVVGLFYGEKLGTSGIKNRLIIEPLAMFTPLWFCYEKNREAAILDDAIIQKAFDDFRTNIYRHHTGAERGDMFIGPGSMAAYMLSYQIRFPAHTAEDRNRMTLLKQHFKAWDRSPDRTKSGQKNHDPDDLAMAAWVGFLKVRQLLEKGIRRGQAMRRAPAAVIRKWDQYQTRNNPQQQQHKVRHAHRTAAQIASMAMGGGENNQ